MWCNVIGMENLDTYLKRTGVSQRKFSEIVGVHPSVLSRFIRHLAHPSMKTAHKIERATDGAVPVAVWKEGLK